MAGVAEKRRSLLARVHIAAKELGLDEETYRTVLDRCAGVSSAAEATDAQLDLVLAEFRRLGWKPRRRKSAKPYVRKIWAMWGELVRRGIWRNRRRSSLRAFVKRQTGIDNPEWLTPSDADAVIEALKTIGCRGGINWEEVS